MSIQSLPVKFKNNQGGTLSGILELPEKPIGFGLFAHCFTCTKNITAAHVISKTLAEKGFAVLRFDFSGLGESEGDFRNTSLTSNVEEIQSANHFLTIQYEPATFLVGHSLGGLAVLHAAKNIENLKACITLNAPANMAHFKDRISEGVDLDGNFSTLLDVMGKKYPIKNHFLDDVIAYKDLNLDNFNVPLLVMHLEEDDVVPFHHSEHIMKKATHLKQLVILNNMNHLLTKRTYCEEVVDFINPWLKQFF